MNTTTLQEDADTKLAAEIEKINKFAEQRIKDEAEGSYSASDIRRIETYRLHQIRNACSDYPCVDWIKLIPLKENWYLRAKDNCHLCGSDPGGSDYRQYCSCIEGFEYQHFVCPKCTKRINPMLFHDLSEEIHSQKVEKHILEIDEHKAKVQNKAEFMALLEAEQTLQSGMRELNYLIMSMLKEKAGCDEGLPF